MRPIKVPRRSLLLASAAMLATHGSGLAADDGADNERWRAIRKSLFGNRPISEDARGILTLEAPLRAADAAVVPIAIRTQLAQTPGRWIRKLMLVVDKNPSPVGATFSFTPESGRADVETRVRVEEYSHVRAIAELNDGSLVMQVRYIKAAGGCSAPAGADLAAAMANLGKIDLRIDESTPPGQPARVQLTVSHPNISGLAIDQLTRLAPAPHYVRAIEVRWTGQPLMSADVDFSISENPSLRFYFLRQGSGELRADVVDNKDLKFHTTLALKATPASSG
jgi:sulfur-oxidizing protein SoxY